MVELLEVEDRGARAHALEREPFDELGDAHDLGAIVVAPAEEREEVDERLREVALGAELLDRDRAVALRELLAVGAEDVGEVPVLAEAARRAPARIWICFGVFEMWSSPRRTCVIPSSQSSTGEAKL